MRTKSPKTTRPLTIELSDDERADLQAIAESRGRAALAAVMRQLIFEERQRLRSRETPQGKRPPTPPALAYEPLEDAPSWFPVVPAPNSRAEAEKESEETK